MSSTSRRQFLQTSVAAIGLAAAARTTLAADEAKKPPFQISLAEYSLHRMIQGGKLKPEDLGPFAKEEFGIDALDRWNGPIYHKATDEKFIAQIKKNDDDAGVKNLLIMIDGEGNLGDPDEAKRKQAVEKHHKWVIAAKTLGCHSIRVNARSNDKLPYEEQMKLAADGLRQLSEFGAKHDCNVIVENHGGLSSNGAWLAGVMKAVDLPNCGTLPDFGNFHGYDRYKGVEETMPWAKSVSAKSHNFDAEGNETGTDYFKMMKIVVDAGYHGYVGIEYEGGKLSEIEGVHATKKLLERVAEKLAA